jgi:hypothetical protein
VQENRLAEFLVARVRERVLRIGIRLVTGWLGEAPKYIAANVHEMRTFFDLPEDEKRRLLQILPFFDSTRDLNDIQENLLYAAEQNDTMTSWAIGLVLAVHCAENYDQVSGIVERLIEIGMSANPSSYFVGQILDALGMASVQSGVETDVFDLYESLWLRRYRTTHCRVRMVRTYIIPTLSAYLVRARRCSRDPSAVYAAMEEAKAIHDAELLLAFLWELAFLGMSDSYYEIALEALAVFVDVQDDEVHTEFINVLARTRQHHPDAVDDFVEAHSLDDQSRRRITTMEVKETGGDLLYKPVQEITRTVAQSAIVRRIIAGALTLAVESRTVNEWLLVLAKGLANWASGREIFDLDFSFAPSSKGDLSIR